MHRAVALLLIGAAYRGADALTIWRQQTERFSDSADYIAVEFLTDALAVVCYRDLEVIEPTANTPTHPLQPPPLACPRAALILAFLSQADYRGTCTIASLPADPSGKLRYGPRLQLPGPASYIALSRMDEHTALLCYMDQTGVPRRRAMCMTLLATATEGGGPCDDNADVDACSLVAGDALTVSDGMVGGFLTLSRYGAINDDVALLCYAHLGDFETEEIPANVTRTAVCQLVRANVGHPCVCAAGERPKVVEAGPSLELVAGTAGYISTQVLPDITGAALVCYRRYSAEPPQTAGCETVRARCPGCGAGASLALVPTSATDVVAASAGALAAAPVSANSALVASCGDYDIVTLATNGEITSRAQQDLPVEQCDAEAYVAGSGGYLAAHVSALTLATDEKGEKGAMVLCQHSGDAFLDCAVLDTAVSVPPPPPPRPPPRPRRPPPHRRPRPPPRRRSTSRSTSRGSAWTTTRAASSR